MPGSHERARRPPSWSRRRKLVVAGATVLVVAVGALGYYAFFPQQAPAFVKQAMATVGITDFIPGAPPPPPPTCPLTGEEAPDDAVPARPALAVKVENAPEARPQAALNDADLVVEEPVEGGLTRFIAIFQCGGSKRVGPVRSARTTDPKFLAQLGVPVLGYSGAAPAVTQSLQEAKLVALDETSGGAAFVRDSSRVSPHNLYLSTPALYREAHAGKHPPDALFAYSDTWEGRSRRVSSIRLDFSSASDVHWTWSKRDGAWLRAHGDVPHELEDGEQVSAANVVVQLVSVTNSGIVDAAGNPSPDVDLVGSGRAYVLRDGRLIVGRWERESLHDPTTFVAKDGTEITLSPGRTWIELLPNWISPEVSR
jgi:hypothetical protein